MKITIVCCPIGIFALNDNLNIVEYVLYGRNAEKVAESIRKISEGTVTKELSKFLSKLVEKGYKTFIFEDEDLARNVSKRMKLRSEFMRESEAGRYIRRNLGEIAFEKGFLKEGETIDEWIRKISIELSRIKVHKAMEKRDELIAKAIQTIDDLEKTSNLLINRLREWYGLHFPELDDLLPEHRDYVRLVYELGSRRKIDVKALTRIGFSEGKAKQIADAAAKSMGAEVSEADLDPIRKLAKLAIDMYDLRKYFEAYISDTMQEVAPNIRELVGPLLGARLIALAGGLENLAKKPASTIQVLGAEKALFRALRTGGKPPKHGVIFQYPEVHRSPKWQRGKIARALAAKLSIAARVDAFTGEFIADQLKRDFEERVAEIKQKYAKPPVKKKKEKAAKKAGGKK